jgi:predicted CXXCH cytochrome family protein
MVTAQKDIAGLSATCPLCHTMHKSVPSALLETGASWACTRCGKKWTEARLKTAA